MIPLSDPDIRRRSFPFINYAFIIANALVFLYELSIGPTARETFFFSYGLIPRELTEIRDVTSISRIFTSMFIHGDILHFSFNMLFLWVFGDNVEDRFGYVKYLVFYLACGVVAALTQVFIDPQGKLPMIGASGAIAGTLGAYFLMFPFSQIRTAVIFIFIMFIRVPAFLLLGFWILLQFFEGLGSLGPSAQGGTAYFAHIGGFVSGMIVAMVWRLFRREPVWERNKPNHWWRGSRM